MAYYYCTSWDPEGTSQYIERYDTLKERNNALTDAPERAKMTAKDAAASTLPIIDRSHSGGMITGQWVRGRLDII